MIPFLSVQGTEARQKFESWRPELQFYVLCGAELIHFFLYKNKKIIYFITGSHEERKEEFARLGLRMQIVC